MSIEKAHPVMQGHKGGIAISPLLQSLYMKFCAELVPDKACGLLNGVLAGGGLTHASQAYRLIGLYGSDASVEEELCAPLQEGEATPVGESAKGAVTGREVLYGMFDGGQFLYDDGYQEVKVGRAFRSSQLVRDPQSADNQGANCRNRVLNSEYLMREGHYKNFIGPFAKLMDAQLEAHPDADLVYLTDGAQWMGKWVNQRWPGALHILDFFHAYEHLCDFAVHLIDDCAERKEQLSIWKTQLKQGRVGQLIAELKVFQTHRKKKVREEVRKLLIYYQNNEHRMDYKTYAEKGYLIGSGAIESAVKNVAQQRCKLSGQRWNNGLQPVLNIRALYRSGKEKRMDKIIVNQFKKAA